jgi:hypothetical protein
MIVAAECSCRGPLLMRVRIGEAHRFIPFRAVPPLFGCQSHDRFVEVRRGGYPRASQPLTVSCVGMPWLIPAASAAAGRCGSAPRSESQKS